MLRWEEETLHLDALENSQGAHRCTCSKENDLEPDVSNDEGQTKMVQTLFEFNTVA